MGLLRLAAWCVSLSLGCISTLAMFGAMSCCTHALVAAEDAQVSMAGAAALGAVTLVCIFVGGMGVAVRVCSLGLASALLLAHLWLSAATAPDLVAAADRLLADVLMPLRNASGLDTRWDCAFFGPADALYMLGAVRHAASVLSSMRQMAATLSVPGVLALGGR